MIIVVKIGGDLLSSGPQQRLIDEVARLRRIHEIVLVHGGGDIVTEISEKLGHPPKFVVSPKGFRSRYTDKEASGIYTMVMAGKINKEIVSALQKSGVNAIGLSGLDGGLVRAIRKTKIVSIDERGRKMLMDGGYTGQITKVDKGLLRLLIEDGYAPVISPVAMGEEAEPLNVDGDRMAASLASALQADRLILLTDVEGIHIEGKPVEKLHASEAEEVMSQIGAGMITKVYASVEAAKGGIPETIIASGLREAAIQSALEHGNGTVIVR